MIRTAEEFRGVREQLGGLAEAAAELREKVYRRNPQKYVRLVQPYVEDIRRLEGLISEYLNFYEVEREQVDIRLRLLGPAARLGVAPASLLSNTLERFTRSVRSVFIHSIRPLLVEPHIRRKADQMCEFAVAALLPGSLQVALNVPSEPTLFEDRELLPKLSESIKLLLSTALWAEGVDFEGRLKHEVQDPVLRNVLLYQAEAISPKRKSGIDVIEFYGKLVRLEATPRFSSAIRERIREILARPPGGQMETTVGSIRELDLDRRSFHLRQRERGLPALRCIVFPGLLEEAVRHFGKRVRVTGRVSGRNQAGEVTTLEIQAIEARHED